MLSLIEIVDHLRTDFLGSVQILREQSGGGGGLAKVSLSITQGKGGVSQSITKVSLLITHGEGGPKWSLKYYIFPLTLKFS